MCEASRTRVLVADDHAVVRRGLALLLNEEPDFEVVAEAADGAEAVEKALGEEIGLVILDVAMPRLSGLQAARELARQRPGLRLLMLSMYDNEQFLFEALRAGASGYVLKSGADRDIVDACRAAMRGEPFLYPAAVTALVRDFVNRTDRHGIEFEAAATLGNAAEILEAHPAAMQLRVLSTMAEVSAERNSTLIFPLPMEILRLVDTLRGVAQPPDGQSPAPAGGQTAPPADRSS